jgi:hypothetical protein
MGKVGKLLQTPTRGRLTIDALAEPTPAVVRLRRVLKALLRHYAFKAVAVEEISPVAGVPPRPLPDEVVGDAENSA